MVGSDRPIEETISETLASPPGRAPEDRLAAALTTYDIGEELGRGGFAVVTAARHRHLGRDVAIKQLAPAMGDDPDLRARFASEARMLASLDHPHIVPVYDFVEADGMYLLIMERLTGGTVAGRLRAGGFTPRAACAVLVATSEALHHAHGKNVLHRDVKPENLLFSGEGVVKVGDFGIAKLLGGASARLTHTGAIFGTPTYMAPEQVVGGEVGPPTDIYAAGVVLYELLTGDHPFPSEGDPLAALYRRLNEEPVPLVERFPDAPRALADVVERALQRDPSDRYATAGELAVAVRRAATDEWGADWESTSGVLLRSPPAGAARGRRPARDVAAPPLLERESDLEAIAAALDDAAAGEGALLVITAPAGMGKTRLAREAAQAAADRGMLALTARGLELERSFPYGVARQLFEPALASYDESERGSVLAGAASVAGQVLFGSDEPTPSIAEAAVDHALYWLVANLAARSPLALVIDDAQWADPPSLSAILHLAARLEGLPVAVVLAARPSEPLAEQDVLDRLTDDPLARHVHPAPLSQAAVATLLRERLSEAEDEFSHACRVASAGNPYLVSELTSALANAGISPTADNSAQVQAMSPQTVARRVQRRLKGLPPEMSAVARAIAIMGGSAAVVEVARAAGLSESEASHAADRLTAIEILAPGRPLEFVHPIVRAAVYDSLSVSERSAGHLAAARIAHSEGAAPETVTNHLLRTEPARDPWVVDRLREAARAAAAVGAMGATVVYLQRALAEPAPAEQRAEILLGLSEGHRHQNAWEEASSELRQALREAGDTALRVEIARRLFSQLMVGRRHREAVDELSPLLAELRESEPDLAVELELSLSTSMWLDDDQAPLLAERALALETPQEGATRRERIVLSRQAWAAVVAGAPADDVAMRARDALSSGELITEDARAHGFEMSVMALALADCFEEAHEHLYRAMAASRARGHMGRWAFLSCAAAHVFLLEGRLLDAEQHALQALDTLRPDGIAFPAAADALIDVLVERGQLAAARHTQDHLADRGPLPDPLLLAGLRLAPARLSVATGDLGLGLERVLAIGRRQLTLGRQNPAWCAWRSTAALIHLELGQPERALALADEELDLARSFGAPRALGVALRAAGLCRGGEEGAQLLSEAVSVLDGSGAGLEHTRALVDLGVLLRRGGKSGGAVRGPLSYGYELALRLGAQPLADRAYDELQAAGAPLPRIAPQKFHLLTPAERQACRLAAEGMGTQQIAEALFVTARTAEERLAAGCSKLGVAEHRHELSAALVGA